MKAFMQSEVTSRIIENTAEMGILQIAKMVCKSLKNTIANST